MKKLVETTDNYGKTIFTNERGDIAYIADQHVENYVMATSRGIRNERMKIVACPFVDGEVLYNEVRVDPKFHKLVVEPIIDWSGTGSFVEQYQQYRFAQYVAACRKLITVSRTNEVL